MSTPTLDRTLPLPELAKAWGWSQDKLYRLCEAEAIPHLRIRGRIYFELSVVEEWKAAHRKAVARREEPRAAATPARDRAAECAALGIDANHEFA